MGLGDWLKRQFGDRGPATEMVPFLDTASRRIVQIPVSELRPGMVRAQLQGTGEMVWVLADQVKPGKVRNPAFVEEVRAYIRRIQEAFAEHRALSFEEWEDGFRRDAYPEQEIALWSHAAEVYRAFADNEVSPARRRDFYRVIVTCLTTSPDTVWSVLELEVLSRPEAEQVVKRVYAKHT